MTYQPVSRREMILYLTCKSRPSPRMSRGEGHKYQVLGPLDAKPHPSLHVGKREGLRCSRIKALGCGEQRGGERPDHSVDRFMPRHLSIFRHQLNRFRCGSSINRMDCGSRSRRGKGWTQAIFQINLRNTMTSVICPLYSWWMIYLMTGVRPALSVKEARPLERRRGFAIGEWCPSGEGGRQT